MACYESYVIKGNKYFSLYKGNRCRLSTYPFYSSPRRPAQGNKYATTQILSNTLSQPAVY